MQKRLLLIATVQSHIAQFHKPLMKLLKEHGWEIHVAARDNLAEKNGLQLEFPDKVFNIPFQRSPFSTGNIGAYRQLKKLLTENHYDVIHCNTPVGGILGRLAARKYIKQGTKVFYTAHGFHFYKGAPRKNWLIYYPIEKWMSRFTDKLITITEEDYALAANRFHCAVVHIHGVGANSEKFFPLSEQEQTAQKAALGLNGHILINCGELLPNKNQQTAILAMAHIVKAFPDAKLLIAGNGPEQATLEHLIAEHSLRDHVTLLGYTTQLQKYLQICDLEIACSHREGLPLNIMEAMLCGKPVVASSNRGHRELIVDGQTGYLVAENAPAAYADAVFRILQDHPFAQDKILARAQLFADVSVVQELSQLYDL